MDVSLSLLNAKIMVRGAVQRSKLYFTTFVSKLRTVETIKQ